MFSRKLVVVRCAVCGKRSRDYAAPPYIALKDSKTKILKGQDYDVCGDGTVVVKAAYGPTPGHQVLYVKLAKTGPVRLA